MKLEWEMNKVTLCPHLILDMPDITPEEVEEKFIYPFIEFINEIVNYNVEVVFSKILMESFEQHFPWSNSLDPRWETFIKNWYGLISSKFRRIHLVNHEVFEEQQNIRCNSLSDNTNLVFNSFLTSIATHSLVNRESEESVFTPTIHCCDYSDFIQLKNKDDFKKSQFTWYKIYPLNLPCIGTCVFIPPQNWRSQNHPRLGGRHGYIDETGKEWIWDLLHNTHWDVQHARQGAGRYNNVTPDGRFLQNP